MAVGRPYPVFPTAAAKGQAVDITSSSGASPTALHASRAWSGLSAGETEVDYVSVELVNRGSTNVTVTLIVGTSGTGTPDEWPVELLPHDGLQMVLDRKVLCDGGSCSAWLPSGGSASAYVEVLRERLT